MIFDRVLYPVGMPFRPCAVPIKVDYHYWCVPQFYLSLFPGYRYSEKMNYSIKDQFFVMARFFHQSWSDFMTMPIDLRVELVKQHMDSQNTNEIQ